MNRKEKKTQIYTDNIVTPCKLCRTESIGLTGAKYCMSCYRELLAEVFLQYPVTGKKLYRKYKKRL